MPEAQVVVSDLETVHNLQAAARLHDMVGATDDEIRTAIGSKFQKRPFRKIVCIGALVARRDMDGWHVEALGAPNLAERDEGRSISTFVHRIGELRAQLIASTAIDLICRARFRQYSTDCQLPNCMPGQTSIATRKMRSTLRRAWVVRWRSDHAGCDAQSHGFVG